MEPVLAPSPLFSIPLIDLVYRTDIPPSERPVFKNSEAVARYLQETWDQNKLELQEQFKVLLLNGANQILGIYEHASGGHRRISIEPKWIFAAAILANASQIILSHNHPSGQLKASKQDIFLTEKIKLGASLLDIAVLDHIIITRKGYYSFADQKLI